MNHPRVSGNGLDNPLVPVLGTLAATLAMALALHAAPVRAADSLRPEVARSLLAAQELMKKGHYKEALTETNKAEAVAGRSPYESFAIDRMRGAAAQQAGDAATAVAAYKAAIATGRMSGADLLQTIEAIAGLEYQSKRYGEVVNWTGRYAKAGGTSSQVRALRQQALYQMQDCTGLAAELRSSGESVPESQWQWLAACYQQRNDNSGYVAALEQWVAAYPSKAAWSALLPRLMSKPGFASRLELDVRRLQRATGTLSDKQDYLSYVQLALADDLPAEASRVIDEGYAAGVMGKGADAGRDDRLKSLARKAVAQSDAQAAQELAEARRDKDGTRLLRLGFNEVAAGRPATGLPWMAQAVADGGTRNADAARLHLGIAYAMSGQKAKAVETLRAVQGTSAESDVARLWITRIQRGSTRGGMRSDDSN
jgi:hypothetical protein